MPMLRRQRRPRNRKGQLRAHAPKVRKRRNLEKFIPEADSDFAFTSHNFVLRVRHFPEKYHVPADEVALLDQIVSEFRAALSAHQVAIRSGRRSQELKLRKDAARERAEVIVRRYANIIRGNPKVSDTDKKLLRIKVRPKRLGKRTCPRHPPRLQFMGSGDGQVGGRGIGSGSGVHVLTYWDGNDSIAITGSCEIGRVRRARPDGAVRVELFFDMIPLGEPVPKTPGARGWPKYLRSFTRSPMEVEFPLPSVPMLIVYWARWADSTGEVSRWSQPCAARVEAWTPGSALPAVAVEQVDAKLLAGRTSYVFIHQPIAGALPEQIEGELPDLLNAGAAMALLRGQVDEELAA